MSEASSGQATPDTATTSATPATQSADTTTAPASATPAAAGTETQSSATTSEVTTETPPAQSQQAEVKTEEPSKPAGAPEKYEFKFADDQRPTEGTLKSFEETAKSLNLTQEAAQTVLDKVIPAMRADARAQLETFYKDIGGMPETWADQVKADKDIGGTKFDDTLAVASKARDTFGGPALNNLLNKTGLGNHPEIIRAFAKVGRAISADRFVEGRAATTDTRQAYDKLYPSKT